MAENKWVTGVITLLLYRDYNFIHITSRGPTSPCTYHDLKVGYDGAIHKVFGRIFGAAFFL